MMLQKQLTLLGEPVELPRGQSLLPVFEDKIMAEKFADGMFDILEIETKEDYEDNSRKND